MLSFSEDRSFQERLHLPDDRDGFVVLGHDPRLHPMHRHIELEFNLVVRGTARYILGDRRYDLRPYALVWLFPEQDHVLLEKSGDYCQWIVVFRPRLIQQVCRSPANEMLHQLNPVGYFCRSLPETDFTRLNDLCGQLATCTDTDVFNAGLGYLLALAWNRYCHADQVARPAACLHPAVEKAIYLLRQDENQEMPLPEIARQCGISSAHLTRLFQQQVGQSPVSFRNQERLRRFLDLYGTGQRMSLLEAAIAAGFGSYPQFHRVFKEKMGCSPITVRRQHGEKERQRNWE